MYLVARVDANHLGRDAAGCVLDRGGGFDRGGSGRRDDASAEGALAGGGGEVENQPVVRALVVGARGGHADGVGRARDLDGGAGERGGGGLEGGVRGEGVRADDVHASGEHAGHLRGVLDDPVLVHFERGVRFRGAAAGALLVVLPVGEGHEREHEVARANLELPDEEANLGGGAIAKQRIEGGLHRVFLQEGGPRRHRERFSRGVERDARDVMGAARREGGREGTTFHPDQ